MTADQPHPSLTPHAVAERQARLDREAEALRANLRRRKQQLRTRGPANEALLPDRRDDPSDAT